MEAVNRALEREFFYQWGRGEKRCQEKIYEEHFSGKYGLNATKRDKNKKLQRVQLSTRRQMEELMRRFEQNCSLSRSGKRHPISERVFRRGRGIGFDSSDTYYSRKR